MKALTNSPVLPTPYRPLTDPLRFQSKLELILEMRDRLTTSLRRAKDAVSQSSEDMKQKMQSLKSSFVGALADMRQEIPLLDKALRLMSNPIVLLTTAIGAVGAGVSRLRQFASESIETYRMQAEAETKLGQVMRNTMGARQTEIDSIKQLASEQQRLGVIGDEVQLAGAQELGTYLTKTKNLKTLLPVLNDMVAQQYGYNATQESAVNIATMMGKVMDGQVGALSRYGYKFDEAQEKILRFGTEEQRAKETADAWRSVDIRKKANAADEATTDEAGIWGNSEADDYSGSTVVGDGESASQTIAGSAKQIRNITVNIEAFNKGGINTTNTEGLQGLSATDIEDWFNQMLLRAIRNIELSY